MNGSPSRHEAPSGETAGSPAGAASLRAGSDAWLAANRRWAAVAVGALGVGLILGWLFLGQWLWPLQQGRATPADLAPDWRDTYVQLVADAYVQENAAARARLRLQAFDDPALQLELQRLYDAPEGSAIGRNNVSELARALGVTVTAGSTLTAGAAVGETDGGLSVQWLVITSLAVLLLGAGAWLVYRGLLVRRRPQATGGAESPPSATADDAFTVQRPAGRGRGAAPPWRPGRLYLGDTITTRYRAGDEPFYQSFLIHDTRGVLVGSVSMQSQRVGSVNTLDLWLVERDDEGREGETPLVTLAARAAAEDSIFRARLSDRQVLPAVPGERVVLETARLVLDARVRAVEPDPAEDGLRLDALTLSLTPERLTDQAQPPEADPPIPLPFRPD